MRRLVVLASLVVACTGAGAPTARPLGPTPTSWSQAIEHGLGMDRTPVPWGDQWCTGLVAFRAMALSILQFGRDLSIPNLPSAKNDAHRIASGARQAISALAIVPKEYPTLSIATAYTRAANDALSMVALFWTYASTHAPRDLAKLKVSINVLGVSAKAAANLTIPDSFTVRVVCV